MSFKSQAKKFLQRSGLLRFRQRMLPPSVVVLGLHSVSEDREGQADWLSEGITTEAERFRELVRILAQEFHPVTMDDLAEWLAGRKTLPRRSVALTFDDGFADNYRLAAPIMEEFGVRGAFYLTVDSVRLRELPWFCHIYYLFQTAKREKQVLHDPELNRTWKFGDAVDNRAAFVHYNYPCARMSDSERRLYIKKLENWFGHRLNPAALPGMMTFEQAKELRQRGHIIGSHSLSHGNLAHIPEEDLEREIVGAHEFLEKELGESIEHFSYPHPCLHPQWNEKTFALTERLNYKTVVLTQPGIVTQSSDPQLLPRVMIGNPDVEEFRWKLETALAAIQT